MKTIILLFSLLFSLPVFAQKSRGPVHGQTFGSKPDTTGVMPVAKLDEFMGKKPRVSVAIRGKILFVFKEKGGWFTLDEGKGRTISAHFKDYNVMLPVSLNGRTVILDGVAAKQFNADDGQHFAGNTRKSSNTSGISFEVNGLYVDK